MMKQFGSGVDNWSTNRKKMDHHGKHSWSPEAENNRSCFNCFLTCLSSSSLLSPPPTLKNTQGIGTSSYCCDNWQAPTECLKVNIVILLSTSFIQEDLILPASLLITYSTSPLHALSWDWSPGSLKWVFPGQGQWWFLAYVDLLKYGWHTFQKGPLLAGNLLIIWHHGSILFMVI